MTIRIFQFRGKNLKEEIVNLMADFMGAYCLMNLSYELNSYFLKIMIVFIGFILIKTNIRLEKNKIKVGQFIGENISFLLNLIMDIIGLYCLVNLSNRVGFRILQATSVFAGLVFIKTNVKIDKKQALTEIE